MTKPRNQGELAGTIVAWVATVAVIVIIVVAVVKLVGWMISL